MTVNVALGIPHTRSIRAGGALQDSNLALCDPQIGDGEDEVCAPGICLLGWPVGDFHFSVCWCDSQNAITDAGGAAVEWTAIFSAEAIFFVSFFNAFVSQTHFFLAFFFRR